LSVERSFTPTTWLFIAMQITFIVLERVGKMAVPHKFLQTLYAPTLPRSDTPNPRLSDSPVVAPLLQDFLSPLLLPAFCIASALTFFLGLGGLLDGLHLHSVSQLQQVLLITALLLTARSQVCVVFLLLA